MLPICWLHLRTAAMNARPCWNLTVIEALREDSLGWSAIRHSNGNAQGAVSQDSLSSTACSLMQDDTAVVERNRRGLTAKRQWLARKAGRPPPPRPTTSAVPQPPLAAWPSSLAPVQEAGTDPAPEGGSGKGCAALPRVSGCHEIGRQPRSGYAPIMHVVLRQPDLMPCKITGWLARTDRQPSVQFELTFCKRKARHDCLVVLARQLGMVHCSGACRHCAVRMRLALQTIRCRNSPNTGLRLCRCGIIDGSSRGERRVTLCPRTDRLCRRLLQTCLKKRCRPAAAPAPPQTG